MNEPIASVLDIDHVTSVIQARCESQGVSLTWQLDAPTAATNGKNIILPTVHSPVTKEAMDKLYGFVVHECGHHYRPEVFKIGNAVHKTAPEGLMALFNIVEDDVMERDVAGMYRGDSVALGRLNGIILEHLAKEIPNMEIPDEVEKHQLAPMAMCGVSQLSRLDWDGCSTAARTEYFDAIHPLAQESINELAEEGYVDRMQNCDTPHDSWDLACDLFKRLYPDADEDEVEDLRSKGHEGTPDEGEGTEADDSTGDGEGEGQEAGANAGEEDDDDTEAIGGEGQVISWKDFTLSEHNEWTPKEPGAIAGNIGIDWTDYTEGEVLLMPQHLINVIDCTKRSTEQPETHSGYGGCGTPESFMSDNKQSRQFGNQIRRYLQAKERTQVHRERYHGTLDKSSLVRLALPPIDGGEYNKRVFYDFIEERRMNTCIHVLTDWSGSMSGNKMKYAADASGRLVFVFDRVLRVPVQLAAFTNCQSECDIGLIKRFNERSVSPMDIATSFSKFYKYSAANNDADAVMWAYNQLKPRKEERKILMVLSDGCPAGEWQYGSAHQNLRHVTKHIEKQGDIEIYGVGICSNAVKTYYTNTRVLQGPEEINTTLMNIIKDGAYR